ncbi:hypothetical protein C8R45DRAFT_524369 [Mycena sanguinolenta]|nr:hypothetical protein C8R45DRAFT_524369 [Mycena sanguinolenta]
MWIRSRQSQISLPSFAFIAGTADSSSSGAPDSTACPPSHPHPSALPLTWGLCSLWAPSTRAAFPSAHLRGISPTTCDLAAPRLAFSFSIYLYSTWLAPQRPLHGMTVCPPSAFYAVSPLGHAYGFLRPHLEKTEGVGSFLVRPSWPHSAEGSFSALRGSWSLPFKRHVSLWSISFRLNAASVRRVLGIRYDNLGRTVQRVVSAPLPPRLRATLDARCSCMVQRNRASLRTEALVPAFAPMRCGVPWLHSLIFRPSDLPLRRGLPRNPRNPSRPHPSFLFAFAARPRYPLHRLQSIPRCQIHSMPCPPMSWRRLPLLAVHTRAAERPFSTSYRRAGLAPDDVSLELEHVMHDGRSSLAISAHPKFLARIRICLARPEYLSLSPRYGAPRRILACTFHTASVTCARTSPRRRRRPAR